MIKYFIRVNCLHLSMSLIAACGGMDTSDGTPDDILVPPGKEINSQDPKPPLAKVVNFKKKTLHDKYYAEGCAFADFNRDGNTDVLLGPFWYPGPKVEEAKQIETPKVYSYGDRKRRHFMSFTHDFDGDGWVDAMSIGYIGTDARWYRNPGSEVENQNAWQQYTIFEGVGGEAPRFVNLVGDQNPELVFIHDGQLGYAIQNSDATKPWQFTAISERKKFDHGLGVGDINGDGLIDVVEKRGWYQQINSNEWKYHFYDFALGKSGGGNMPVADLDGDGDNDIVASIDGHGYGLYWFEQVQVGDKISFLPHEILPLKAGSDNFSQLHAITLSDINGDGQLDIITGKRWWAHQGSDPGARDPAVIYWLESVDKEGKLPSFKAHLIDDNSGIGLQVCAEDVSGDGLPDVAASNKKGVYVHLSE